MELKNASNRHGLDIVRGLFVAQAWQNHSQVSWGRRHEPLLPCDPPELHKFLENQSVLVLSLQAGKAA